MIEYWFGVRLRSIPSIKQGCVPWEGIRRTVPPRWRGTCVEAMFSDLKVSYHQDFDVMKGNTHTEQTVKASKAGWACTVARKGFSRTLSCLHGSGVHMGPRTPPWASVGHRPRRTPASAGPSPAGPAHCSRGSAPLSTPALGPPVLGKSRPQRAARAMQVPQLPASASRLPPPRHGQPQPQ